MNEATTTTSGSLPEIKFADVADAIEAINAHQGWALDRLYDFCKGGLKVSQMLSLITLFGELPVAKSIYLRQDDIIFLNYTGDGFALIGKGREFRVGERVYNFLSQAEDISPSAWCWYRAKSMGLERPYVSIG